VTNTLKSPISTPEAPIPGDQSPNVGTSGVPAGWIKVGAFAAASAVLGGLAAAWFYRKTLSQLREAGNETPDSPQSITENETEEDF